MNDYEIGKDFEMLRSRLERLESSFAGHSPEARLRKSGVSVAHSTSAGVDGQKEPQFWRAEREMRLPLVLTSLWGVPERLRQFNLVPESKSWMCQPEPLLLFVNWNAGGSDEFYRLQNQVFSITRITEPNSGHISCSATYFARLVASGKASSHRVPATSSYSGYVNFSQFRITLRGFGGAFLGSYTSPAYSIACHDNYDFIQTFDFNAGQYDLVTGATWEVIGAQDVDRC